MVELERGGMEFAPCPRQFKKRMVIIMILLTKRNEERFLINHTQIECIEMIPETKVVMMNHDYYLVKETVEEIIDKIAAYNAKVMDIHSEITVTDRR